MAILGLFKMTAAFHSVRQVSPVALPPLRFPESDRVTKLCSAADSDERLFWKLLKGQKSSSQMSAFLVNGSLITDINEIRNMWADPFEALGTPSESATYDNGFAALVSAHVKETVEACLDDPGGILNEPLRACSHDPGTAHYPGATH